MIIDTENHFATEAWAAALLKNEGYPRLEKDPENGKLFLHFFEGTSMPLGLSERLLDLGPGRIAALDAAGIDVAVLSQAVVGVEAIDPAIGTPLARYTNDALAAAIDRYPDRLLGFASLAPRDVDSAVEELERVVKEFGFRGWNTLSNFGDSFLDEKRYWPLLAKCEELDVPIYLHPVIPAVSELRTYGWGLAGAAFGFGAEASMVMMRMIISGVFDTFPRLRIILGHYGEGFPFMMNRVDRPFLQGHVRPDPKAPTLQQMPSAYLRNNMVVSTSGNYSADAFLCTKNALGADHMTIGTDYPFEDMNECMAFLADQPMTEHERKSLHEGTATKLGFGVD